MTFPLQLPEPSILIVVGIGLVTMAVIAWVRSRRRTARRTDKDC